MTFTDSWFNGLSLPQADHSKEAILETYGKRNSILYQIAFLFLSFVVLSVNSTGWMEKEENDEKSILTCSGTLGLPR